MNRNDKAEEWKSLFPKTSFLEHDKELQEIMKKHIFADVYSHGDLSFEMREYITLAILAAQDGNEMIKDHVKALHLYGVAANVIKEAMYQAIPYAGLLKVDQALNYVHEAMEELGIDTFNSMSQVDETTRFKQGYMAQCSVFTSAAMQVVNEQSPSDIKHIHNSLSAHCFGDFYTRKGLTMQERELLTFCVIASLGGCENQLRSHVKANLATGNTRSILIEAITQCQPYIGYPRTLNAIAIIDEITIEEEHAVNIGNRESKTVEAFPLGEENKAFAPYFHGKSYLNMLVKEPLAIANVTFEPACRNHWHIHHKGGQILLVTRGEGWYQEWGRSPQFLKVGDVVNIPAEVKHWHGATNDCWFSHIAIAVPASGANDEWLEEVSETTYQNLYHS